MRLFLSVILFTLLGTLSASPVRLRARGGHEPAVPEEMPGPPKEMLEQMGDIEYSWTMYKPRRVADYNIDPVYELVDFRKNSKARNKKALVLVHKGNWYEYLDIQRQQFEKIGVLIAWGWASNIGTHFIVIEMTGIFHSKLTPVKNWQDLLTEAQKKYKSDYGMILRTQGDHFNERYTFGEKPAAAYPIFGAIEKEEVPVKEKDVKVVEKVKSNVFQWVWAENLPDSIRSSGAAPPNS